MPRHNAALALSDFLAPVTEVDAPPPTKRFDRRGLAAALAAMEQAKDPVRPNTDDEPTLEAPAPALPAGLPSPLGDDELPAPMISQTVPKWAPEETLSLKELGLDLDAELAALVESRTPPPNGAKTFELNPRRPPHPLSPESPDRSTWAVVAALWMVAATATGVLAYLIATTTSAI